MASTVGNRPPKHNPKGSDRNAKRVRAAASWGRGQTLEAACVHAASTVSPGETFPAGVPRWAEINTRGEAADLL